jgi:hypothetical protein
MYNVLNLPSQFSRGPIDLNNEDMEATNIEHLMGIFFAARRRHAEGTYIFHHLHYLMRLRDAAMQIANKRQTLRSEVNSR